MRRCRCLPKKRFRRTIPCDDNAAAESTQRCRVTSPSNDFFNAASRSLRRRLWMRAVRAPIYLRPPFCLFGRQCPVPPHFHHGRQRCSVRRRNEPTGQLPVPLAVPFNSFQEGKVTSSVSRSERLNLVGGVNGQQSQRQAVRRGGNCRLSTPSTTIESVGQSEGRGCRYEESSEGNQQ
jgi:hypothetical protein